MRRSPNIKLKQYLLDTARDKTIKELLPIVNKEFELDYKENDLRRYCFRNRIPYKYEDESKIRVISKIPVGTERYRDDGMVLVKTKDKWEYKQRIIYEQYHNVKLTDNDYIIFLNHDRTDYRIENLMRINRKESSYLASTKTFSKNPKATELGVIIAKLLIKTQ